MNQLFPNMCKQSIDYYNNCEIRIENKSGKGGNFGCMGQSSPMLSLGMIGSFGGERSIKKYLHLLIDHTHSYTLFEKPKRDRIYKNWFKKFRISDR